DLQKTLRIDVDVAFDRAVLLRRLGEPAPQIGREVEVAPCAQEQAKAMAATHQSERRFSRAEYPNIVKDRRGAGERAPIGFGVVLVGRGNDDGGKPAIRRIMCLLA